MTYFDYWIKKGMKNPLHEDEDFFIAQKQPCCCEMAILMRQGCQCGGA